jgi:porphobilinogen synthase
MPFPIDRPRRLRRSRGLRDLASETALRPVDLVYPAFVREGIDAPVPIAAMPGQSQETLSSLSAAVGDARSLGCAAVLLFGVPVEKDAEGSQAWDQNGIVQRAVRQLRAEHGSDLVIITDCCLDEYTDHGHCGVLDSDGQVDNDATLELYTHAALSQAHAGADIIAPSGMMDGQVAAIRESLDDAGFSETGILAYSAKYASVLYGPFREAADCAPRQGDRHGYQMDVRNAREALREVQLDLEEGADMVMIKPALSCLDIVARVREQTDVPLAAYSVSGEYAMIRAAAARGAFDEKAAVLELLTSIRRAGADLVVTYHAREAARWLREHPS